MATAERQLTEVDEELSKANLELSKAKQEIAQHVVDANRFIADTVPDAIEGFTRLLTTMARQYRPGAEWSSSAVNAQTLQAVYEKTFTDFINNTSYREASPALTASVHYRLGQLHFLLGNHLDARESLDAAIALAMSVDDAATAGLAGNTRGCLHAALGENQSALDDFQQSLRLLSRKS